MTTLLMLLIGCPPADTGVVDSADADADTDADTDSDTDSDADTDSDTDTDVGQSTAIMTTTDFSVGALVTADLDTQTVTEHTDIPSDAGVVVEDGKVFVMGRYGYDWVRMYTPGSYDAPELEFSVGENNNPYDVAICGDKLYVALYGADYLGIYDQTSGALSGTVDLSEFNDSDTVGPEVSSLVVAAGALYVGMNRLDRSGEWWVGEGGKVAEVDCATDTVTDSWDAGGNTQIFDNDGETLLVAHEAYGEIPAGISVIDPGTGGFTTVFSEEGIVPTGIAISGTDALMTIRDADYNYGVVCADLSTGENTDVAWTGWFIGTSRVNDRGEVYVAAGAHWANEADAVGAAVYDIATCELKSMIEPTLPVGSVAFY